MVKEGRAVAEALVAASAELRRREVARGIRVDELDHRVTNTLAMVKSLAGQSLELLTGEAAGKARATFEARLLALARAHDVLTRENWASAPIERGLASELRGTTQIRFRHSGVSCAVTASLGAVPA